MINFIRLQSFIHRLKHLTHHHPRGQLDIQFVGVFTPALVDGNLFLDERRTLKTTDDGFGCMKIMDWIAFVLKAYVILLFFSPLVREARQKCGPTWQGIGSLGDVKECLHRRVLIAPPNTPGVSLPPI